MDHEQTALVPAGGRQLRDLLRRQVEVVVAGTEPDLHRSEQRALLRPRCLETEVAIRLRGGEPATGGTLQEAVLDQERLVDLLDRARVLRDRRGDGPDAHWTSIE